MNAELRNLPNSYCCCDQSICQALPRDLLFSCEPLCDVHFNVSISHCEPLDNCSVSTISQTIENSSPDSDYGFVFNFDLETVPEDVSELLLLSSLQSRSCMIENCYATEVTFVYRVKPL